MSNKGLFILNYNFVTHPNWCLLFSLKKFNLFINILLNSQQRNQENSMDTKYPILQSTQNLNSFNARFAVNISATIISF